MNYIDKVRQKVFENLWQNYLHHVEFAPTIEKALTDKGDPWVEDHVAFRCLPGSHCGSHVLKEIFSIMGYKEKDTYRFEEKSLDAFWMAPPNTKGAFDDASPKVFISELDLAKFDQPFKDVVTKYSNQVNENQLIRLQSLKELAHKGDQQAEAKLISTITHILTAPPPWQRPTIADYEILKSQSEYASWTLLFGSQVNHFTVSAHSLGSFQNIQQLYDYIRDDLSIPMNSAGGEIKGTPETKLEQISTMASKIPFLFQDGEEVVPYGFVEFAYRYPKDQQKADKNWDSYFQGFVAANANKIFESTFTGPGK